MPEILFVIKSFLISLVILFCLQIKISDQTLESHATEFAQTSSVAKYINTVASGAALVIQNSAKKVSDQVREVFGGEPEVSTTQKAGRLQQFELKRSSAVAPAKEH